MLSFNGTLILVVVSFVLFMLGMKALFFDPIFRIKAERERKMREDRDNARQYGEDHEKLLADYEAALSEGRKKAQQLILEARQSAKQSAAGVIGKARDDARNKIDAQLKELAQWRENSYRELAPQREALVKAVLEKVAGQNRVPA